MASSLSSKGVTATYGTDRIAALLNMDDPMRRLSDGLKRAVEPALQGKALSPEDARMLVGSAPDELDSLCKAASILRDSGKGHDVSFSPKVFIPLTMLCRDFCGYCTFRQDPATAPNLYMTPEEVLEVARAGEKMGCTEALFTLGERPEQRYPEAKEWLRRHGYKTTLDYLLYVSRLVLDETSLLPHGNPGTMSRREMEGLRDVNVSMGVMLESISQRLCEPGGPHELAPSKFPGARLKTIETAGRLKIPFTTGILIGIGETLEERVDSLLAIRELHQRYGHIQEVIIQNFRAKPNTVMSHHAEPGADDLLWTVAVARLILGPEANVQVPPNLSAREYPMFLLAGINDWGGISPITIDYVNPEAPWPQIATLDKRTREFGFALRPRLPVYPDYLAGKDGYLPNGLQGRVKSMTDEDGYVKGGIGRYVGYTS